MAASKAGVNEVRTQMGQYGAPDPDRFIHTNMDVADDPSPFVSELRDAPGPGMTALGSKGILGALKVVSVPKSRAKKSGAKKSAPSPKTTTPKLRKYPYVGKSAAGASKPAVTSAGRKNPNSDSVAASNKEQVAPDPGVELVDHFDPHSDFDAGPAIIPDLPQSGLDDTTANIDPELLDMLDPHVPDSGPSANPEPASEDIISPEIVCFHLP